jgi:hypothetical protein
MPSFVYDFRSYPDEDESYVVTPDPSIDSRSPFPHGDLLRSSEDLIYPQEYPDRREYPEDSGYSPDFPCALGMFSVLPGQDFKVLEDQI